MHSNTNWYGWRAVVIAWARFQMLILYLDEKAGGVYDSDIALGGPLDIFSWIDNQAISSKKSYAVSALGQNVKVTYFSCVKTRRISFSAKSIFRFFCLQTQNVTET